ncbi:uncharacterized protein LOC132543814 isoform X2 [Ylistrum balloti]|uniref:uncharacterized protein LOC132543814 isoform X2 n=1 Tax=Ylistrum balloti TaxID=509963 RepID=UPI002905922E|nr:uncharacterized protein LOC132543814 isoform X2 [Ylistrum balloti]
METKQELTSCQESAIDVHNDLVDYIGQKLDESAFERLRDFFTDIPFKTAELVNIKSVRALVNALIKHTIIDIGNYAKLIQKLRRVHPQLAIHVQKKEDEIKAILNDDANLSAVNTPTASTSQETQKIHDDLVPMIAKAKKKIKTEIKEKTFLKTKAFRDAQEKLPKNKIVVIKGNIGDGKTSYAIRLMDWLVEEQQCRNPLQLHKIENLDLMSPSSNLIAFIDDIFGKKDLGRIDEWDERITDVETLFLDEQIEPNFLLITIRNEIFNALKKSSLGKVFNEENIIDLSSDKYKILEERKSLLELYKPEDENFSWTQIERDEILICSPKFGFPQCCYLFRNVTELQKNRTQFFKTPIKFFIETLARLPQCSAILFLFLSGGKVKATDLDPNSDKINTKYKTLLDQAFNIKLFDGGDNRAQMTDMERIGFVKESLEKLLGGLVVKEKRWLHGGVYRFSHASINVTVALLYGKKTPFGYIKYCPREFLRYLTTSETSSNMVVISPDHYTCLCERLLRAFECNTYDVIIGSLEIWKDRVFVERFFRWLNYKEVNELDMLNKACYNGAKECVLYLLRKGVKPDKATQIWLMILGGYIFRGGKGDVNVLKEVVTYLNEEIKLDLLKNACDSGSEECALYLLREGVRPDKDTECWPLISGDRYGGKGDVDVLKKVVTYLNDENKLVLLNRACDSGSEECALYLLREGVKPDKDTKCWPLISGDRYRGKGDVDVLKKVVTYLNDENKLVLLNRACDSGSEECVLYLLREGVKPDKDTMLHVAKGGSVNLFRKLLQYGITPTSRDGNNDNALHKACQYERNEMVTMLCDSYPYLVHDTNEEGQTPLQVVAETGNCCLFQKVETTTLESLCRVEREQNKCETVDGHIVHRSCACAQYMSKLVDDEGQTVLHVSCRGGHKEVCVYLCETFPALTAAVDDEGRTALHVSCMEENEVICEYLCENFPSLTIDLDNNGGHFLHYVAEYMYFDDVGWFQTCETYVKQYLESTGERYDITNIIDWYGRSILHVAMERIDWKETNLLYYHLAKVFAE